MNNGMMNTKLGEIAVDTAVVAKYAGSSAVECFGVVGMASISMKDGLVKLLKRDNLTHGVGVAIKDNKIIIDLHIIVSYGVSISAVAENLISNWNAAAITGTSTVSCSFTTFVKPRKSCDKITPELPLAPRREPEEIAFASDFISRSCIAVTSFAADMIVSVIFVPVSPSGTGKTFNSLMYSFFASILFAPARNIFCNSDASTVFRFTCFAPPSSINLLRGHLPQRY